MPTKTLPEKKRESKINKANSEFKRLTKPQKRVAIAEDIIAQVRANNYKAKAGRYISLKGDYKLNDKSSAQEALIENKIKCTVCGIGSLFCSLIKFENKATIEDLRDVHLGVHDWDDRGRVRLHKYFSKEQLSLIESAFEKSDGYGTYIINIDEEELAATFAKRNKIRKADDLLIAIMENIISNNGLFKP